MAKENFFFKVIRFIFTFITGDYTRKTVVSAVPMIMFDFMYATFAAVIAAIYASAWLAMMSIYYFFLTIMKIRLMYRAGRGFFSRNEKFSKGNNLKSFSKWLFFMDLLLLVALYFMTRRGLTHEYPGFLVDVIAIYVVYKMSAAVFNMFRARKHGTLVAKELRIIGIVEALVSVLALESALNFTYGNRYEICSNRTMFLTGGGIFVFIMIIVVIGRIRGRASLLRDT